MHGGYRVDARRLTGDTKRTGQKIVCQNKQANNIAQYPNDRVSHNTRHNIAQYPNDRVSHNTPSHNNRQQGSQNEPVSKVCTTHNRQQGSQNKPVVKVCTIPQIKIIHVRQNQLAQQ